MIPAVAVNPVVWSVTPESATHDPPAAELQYSHARVDVVAGVDKLVGFVRSASTFTQQPAVIDGASDLLVEILGENGRHARTATGVAQLPFGAAVQLEMVMRLRDN